MDQVLELKVSAAASHIKLAYVMNRYSALSGRTPDIDTFFATITETVQSIFRDRQNETYTDADRIAADQRNMFETPSSWYSGVGSFTGTNISDWVYRSPVPKERPPIDETSPCV